MQCGDEEKIPTGDAQTPAPVSLRRVGVSQAGGVAGRRTGVARVVLIIVVTAICLLPSLLLCVDAQLAIGAERGMIALAVVSVVLAPLTFLAVKALWAEAKVAAFGVALLGAVFFSYNLVNAVGSASVSRDTASDTRGLAIKNAGLLQTRHAEVSQEVSQLRRITLGDTPGMVEAAIGKLKVNPVFARSGQCGKVTLGDSGDLCRQIANETSRLEAARKVERLEAERSEIWGKLTAMETAPSAADPQVKTLRTWAGMVSATVGDWIDVYISAGLVGYAALAAELAGAFGPMIVLIVIDLAMSRRRFEVREPSAAGIPTTLSVEVEPVKSAPGIPRAPRKLLPSPKKAKPRNGGTIVPPSEKRDATADDLAAWASDRLTPRAGSMVKAGILQQDFAAWASERGIELPNNWPNRFGDTMKELGYAKVRARNVQYQDIAIKGAVLSVVAG